MRLMRRSRTLRKGVGACVASVFLAELATFPWHGVSAPRAGHASFVSTEQRTDIFVREYCRRCAGGSERGAQHRAVELVKRAGFPGHCCTVIFSRTEPPGNNQRPRYVCNTSLVNWPPWLLKIGRFFGQFLNQTDAPKENGHGTFSYSFLIRSRPHR